MRWTRPDFDDFAVPIASYWPRKRRNMDRPSAFCSRRAQVRQAARAALTFPVPGFGGAAPEAGPPQVRSMCLAMPYEKPRETDGKRRNAPPPATGPAHPRRDGQAANRARNRTRPSCAVWRCRTARSRRFGPSGRETTCRLVDGGAARLTRRAARIPTRPARSSMRSAADGTTRTRPPSTRAQAASACRFKLRNSMAYAMMATPCSCRAGCDSASSTSNPAASASRRR